MQKDIIFISIDPAVYRRRVLNQVETAQKLKWKPRLITTLPKITMTANYPVHYVSQPFKRGPLRFLHFNYKVLRILFNINIDIIHARGLWVLPAVLIAGFFKKFKLVYDAHEFFAGHQLFQKHLWRRLTWLKLEKFAIPKIDTLITVAEPLGKYYQELYPSLKKIEIIRSLPVLETNIPVSKEDNPVTKLVFHGYLLPGRGLSELMEALAVLKTQLFFLEIIGEGPLKKSLEEKIKKLGLSEKTKIKPLVASDKLIAEIKNADLGIALIEPDSINRANALPNKFFEYIHAGVPVIASNIPTLKEYVNRYKVGFIADPYNKAEIVNTLKEAIDNKSQLKLYRMNCIKAAKKLCWQNESAKLENVYLSL